MTRDSRKVLIAPSILSADFVSPPNTINDLSPELGLEAIDPLLMKAAELVRTNSGTVISASENGLIASFGAVSPQVASAMADGALARFGADTAVAITGVAGPGGGTEAKPVGYVCWSVKTSDGRSVEVDRQLPGNRAEIRDRSTTVAMHLLRRLLRGDA